jgi:hypothetical protein
MVNYGVSSTMFYLLVMILVAFHNSEAHGTQADFAA